MVIQQIPSLSDTLGMIICLGKSAEYTDNKVFENYILILFFRKSCFLFSNVSARIGWSGYRALSVIQII